MSENLIYGADITSYGAVGDGKTDCSDAFIKAIENGESLIVVPYGKYLLKKALKLSSNLKLHLHPNATIFFDAEDAESYVQSNDCCSVIITGGNWTSCKQNKTLFKFSNSASIRISNCNLTGFDGITFENCEDISVQDTTFNIEEDCLSFCNKCHDISIRSICANNAHTIFRTTHSLKIENIYLNEISGNNCDSFFNFDDSELDNVKAYGISGSFSNCIISTNDDTIITNAEFSNINTYCINPSNKYGNAYFLLYQATLDGVEISNFRRNTDYEARPVISTLVFEARDNTTAIIDGMMLDNVINARALSKTVDMTTARLTNPTNKFIYTLECGIKKNDTLTIPLGDFDNLTIYKR